MSSNLRLRALRNFGSLSLGRTLGDVLTFFLFVVLSRVYGEEGTGQYSIAMALTGFFAVGVDFGLYGYAIREMNLPQNRTPAGRRRLLGQVFGARLVLAFVAFSALALFLPQISPEGATPTIILWIGIYQVLYLLFDVALTPFVAEEDMVVASVYELILRTSIAAAAIGLALRGWELDTVVSVFPILTLVVGLFACWNTVRRFGMPSRSELFGSFRETLHRSKDFALYVFLRQLASRADVILIGLLLGAISAGVYNAAYRIVFMLVFLPYFAGMSLLPQATRLFEAEASTGDTPTGDTANGGTANGGTAGTGNIHTSPFSDLLSHSLNGILLLAVPISAGLWLIAPETIQTLYGAEQFQDSVWILRSLSGLVFLAFLKLMLGTFLTASQRQPERVRGQWIAALCNVIGNLILIPTVGLAGAVVATLVAEAGATAYYWFRLRQLVPALRYPTFFFPAILSAALFVVLFELLWRPPLVVIVLVSGLIYAAAMSIAPGVRREGLPFLLSLRARGPK